MSVALLYGRGTSAIGENITLTQEQLADRLATPKRSSVTFSEYLAMSRPGRLRVKGAAGWLCSGASIAGCGHEGHRCNRCITSHVALPLDFEVAPPSWREGLAASEVPRTLAHYLRVHAGPPAPAGLGTTSETDPVVAPASCRPTSCRPSGMRRSRPGLSQALATGVPSGSPRASRLKPGGSVGNSGASLSLRPEKATCGRGSAPLRRKPVWPVFLAFPARNSGCTTDDHQSVRGHVVLDDPTKRASAQRAASSSIAAHTSSSTRKALTATGQPA